MEQPIAINQPANGRLMVTVNEPPVTYGGDFWIDDAEGWDITSDTLKLSHIRVRVVKSVDSLYTVTVERYSRGRNRSIAMNRASRIQYNVSSIDSMLVLGSGFSIDKGSKYRGQKVLVEISVPVGKRIHFDESVVENLSTTTFKWRENRRDRRNRKNWDNDWNYSNNFDWKAGVDYVMTESGTLSPATEVPYIPPTVDSTKTNADSLQKIIDERNRQNQLDKEKLDKIKRQQQGISASVIERQRSSIQLSIPFIPTII
jgi:hypothetical protein